MPWMLLLPLQHQHSGPKSSTVTWNLIRICNYPSTDKLVRKVQSFFVSSVFPCCSHYLCSVLAPQCSHTGAVRAVLDVLLAAWLFKSDGGVVTTEERIYKEKRTSPCINSDVQYVTCLMTNRIILPFVECCGKKQQNWHDTQYDKDTTLVKGSCVFISQQGIIAQK